MGNFDVDNVDSIQEHNLGSVFLGDIDNDGDLDVLVSNYVGSYANQAVRIYTNTTTGQDMITFSSSSEEVPAASGIAGTTVVGGVSLGDLDQDGDLDVFMAIGHYDYGTSASFVVPSYVYVNTSPGMPNTVSFGDPTSPVIPNTVNFFGNPVSIGPLNYGRDVALGYIDDDSNLDAVVVNTTVSPNPTVVYTNNIPAGGSITASGFSTEPIMGSSNQSKVYLGDIDGDGFLDVLTGDKSIFVNDGSGGFTLGSTLTGMANSDAALGHFGQLADGERLNFNNPSSTKCIETPITDAIEITLADGTVKKGLCPKVQ